VFCCPTPYGLPNPFSLGIDVIAVFVEGIFKEIAYQVFMEFFRFLAVNTIQQGNQFGFERIKLVSKRLLLFECRVEGKSRSFG
jgi:hypothetical protein